MTKTKTETKLKNLEGMKGAIESIVAQAWERGYKYGLHEAEQKNQIPHGKWLTHQTGLLLWEECNQCHAQVGTVGMNFCPNCGTDMREDRK